MKKRTPSPFYPSIFSNLVEEQDPVEASIIRDLMAHKVKATPDIYPWMLHIGPINKNIVDLIDHYSDFKAYLVDDDYSRYRRMCIAYGNNQRVFYMTVTGQEAKDRGQKENLEHDPIPYIKEAENAKEGDMPQVMPYPFRRPFSFVSISKGNFSWTILQQISLDQCQILCIDNDLNDKEWSQDDYDLQQYQQKEKRRMEIYNYCAKYKLVHLHTSTNQLIFYRL